MRCLASPPSTVADLVSFSAGLCGVVVLVVVVVWCGDGGVRA